jgi:hypothetical protein
MLLSPAFEVMSGPPESPGHLSRVRDDMVPTDPRWFTLYCVRSTGLIVSISSPWRVSILTDQRVSQSPYLGVYRQYQSSQQGSILLTPTSLADIPYIQYRPSPGVSHRSQEYPYIDDAVVPQGLGITSSYHNYIPAPTSSPNFGYQPSHHQQQYHQLMDFRNYGPSHTSSPCALGQPSSERPKRQMTSNILASQRNSPVRILPHPEGLQRLERERRGSQTVDPTKPQPQKSRPAGRDRRDPQAEEEDAFVENLRAQNLTWKVVAEMFRERYGKNTSEARIQMRMLRRRKVRQQVDEVLLLSPNSVLNFYS